MMNYKRTIAALLSVALFSGALPCMAPVLAQNTVSAEERSSGADVSAGVTEIGKNGIFDESDDGVTVSPEEDFSYTVNEDGAGVTIDKYTANENEVIVPAAIGGLPVTAIGSTAFYGKDLRSAVIPEGVTDIGRSAFASCKFLNSVTLPDSLTNLGENAFSDCTALGSIVIPDGVTVIEPNAFFRCYSLSSVTLPDGLTRIEESAFQRCGYLSEIQIPDSVTYIGALAFHKTSLQEITLPRGLEKVDNCILQDCEALTKVVIPDGVTEIGAYVFDGCTSLTDVTVPETVTKIGRSVFTKTPWLAEKQAENPLVFVNGILVDATACEGEITLPDGMTCISDNAFSYCTGITGVIIPEGVTVIGSEVFQGCYNLTSITVPASVTEIGYNAFYTYSDVTIKGYTGSYAETYAENNYLRFESIGAYHPFVLGDVTENGAVEADDAQMTLKAYVNMLAEKDTGLTDTQKKAADVDGDGEITATDAQIILKYYVNILAGKNVTWEQLIPKQN